jgi:hypothetical protein
LITATSQSILTTQNKSDLNTIIVKMKSSLFNVSALLTVSMIALSTLITANPTNERSVALDNLRTIWPPLKCNSRGGVLCKQVDYPITKDTSIYNGTVEIPHHSVPYNTSTLTATSTSTCTPIPNMTAVAGAAGLVPELGGMAVLVAGVLAAL